MPQVILPRVGILSFLDDEMREQLVGYGQVTSTKPDQVIIKEGDPSRSLYVVLEGSFAITKETPGQSVPLDSVGEGDCLGEISVFEPGLASATVKSAGAGKLWGIDSKSLQQFLVDAPYSGCALVLGINTLLSRRLRKATSVIKVNQILPGFLSVRSANRTRT